MRVRLCSRRLLRMSSLDAMNVRSCGLRLRGERQGLPIPEPKSATDAARGLAVDVFRPLH